VLKKEKKEEKKGEGEGRIQKEEKESNQNVNVRLSVVPLSAVSSTCISDINREVDKKERKERA
jgi:hypothetical protein